jgi:hypothetical protein
VDRRRLINTYSHSRNRFLRGTIPPLQIVNAKFIKTAEVVVAILLSALVAFLFFVRATHAGGLWRDECDSVELARLPTFADIIHNLKFTSFPILFPTTIRIFTNLLGTSDAALRGFGFLIGVAFLAIAWFNARKNHGDVPLILPALLGLNLTFLTDGTWIRGYGLGGLFVVLATGLTWLFVARPTALRLSAMLLVYLAGMESLVFDAALFPALLGSAFLVCLLRRQWKWAGALCLVGALCAISYLPQFLTLREIKPWTMLLDYPITPALIWREFVLACGDPVPFVAIAWLLVVSISILGAAFLMRRSAQLYPGLLLFGLVAIVAAATTYNGFLGYSHIAPQTRYHLALLFLLAALAELIISTLGQLQSGFRVARLGLVLLFAVTLPFFNWSKITERETTVDLLAKNLAQYARADDLIVVNPWFLGPSFSWYYHGKTRWVTLPDLTEKRIHRYDLIKIKMEQTDDPIADVKSAITQTLQSGNRVWLVGGAQPTEATGPMSLKPAPDPVFKWSSQAYTYAWSMQIGDFLQRHVVDGEVALSPQKGISINENIPLVIGRGWRD